MANNILDLEPKKIKKIDSGVQTPTIRVANEDISTSVNNLTNTIMSIGSSIIQNNKRKEMAERKDLEKQEKENLNNYNKIFKLQSKEMMNSGYAKMTSEMEKFYDNPTAFNNSIKSSYDNNYKAISDNKGLTELTKAELQVENEKGNRLLVEKFRTGVNKFNTQKNKDNVDDTANKLINDIPNYVYDGDAESAQNALGELAEVLEIGMKINPDEYTNDNIAQTLGVVTSRYLESYVGSSIEKYKDEHDLGTTEGVNDFIKELVAYDKNFNSKEMKAFFADTFKDLPYEHKDINTKVHGMIKKQVEQQLWMAKNKKIGIKERTLKQKQEDQKHPHNILQREGILFNGNESNQGQRAKVIGALLDKEFSTDIEAGIVAEENGIVYSTFSKDEMQILKKSLEPMLKLNDSEGVLEKLNENYNYKVLDEFGDVAFPYDEDMFFKDIIEATGGLIDGNYFKAYRNDDNNTVDNYITSLRFGSKNEIIGGNTGDLTLDELGGLSIFSRTDVGFLYSPIKVSKRLLSDEPMKVLNDKITYMSINMEDIEEPERLRTLVNNWAYSYFYENTLSDEDKIAKFNAEDDKGKKRMMESFYDKKENMAKLSKASETLSENFLSGNMVEITSGKMKSKILVSNKFKDLDYNGIKNNVIEFGNLIYVNPNNNEPYTINQEKLRNNLIIETVGEDRIGFFYKDKQHPLKLIENKEFKNAETDLKNIDKFGKDVITGQGFDFETPHFITEMKKEMAPMDKKINKTVLKIRNVRNNNPGNLKEVGIPWLGKLKETDSGGKVASGNFTKFKTPQYGVRALRKDLTTKINRGLNTIESILNVYAPQGRENDTVAYIKAVSEATGIDSNQPLTKDDMFVLVRAIISHEGGKQSLHYYTDEVIREGIKMK